MNAKTVWISNWKMKLGPDKKVIRGSPVAHPWYTIIILCYNSQPARPQSLLPFTITIIIIIMTNLRLLHAYYDDVCPAAAANHCSRWSLSRRSVRPGWYAYHNNIIYIYYCYFALYIIRYGREIGPIRIIIIIISTL